MPDIQLNELRTEDAAVSDIALDRDDPDAAHAAHLERTGSGGAAGGARQKARSRLISSPLRTRSLRRDTARSH